MRRVTIVLDEELIRKLREKQAKQIKESSKSVSFSQVVNETLKNLFSKLWVMTEDVLKVWGGQRLFSARNKISLGTMV